MTKHPTDLKQVSALTRRALEHPAHKTVADYGAGTGTKALELAASLGKNLLRCDPALPETVNLDLVQNIHRADILVCANVLNVILDDRELQETIVEILELAARTKTRTAWISIYQAPKPSNTQRGTPPSDYLVYVRHAARRAHALGLTPVVAQASLAGNVITVSYPDQDYS